VTHALKRAARAAVVSAVLASAALPLLLAGPAQAAPPCWKTLINDWYDSTIDGRYPIPCYQQAVAHLPTDARLYSSAKEDILRAMAREVALKKAEETPTTTEAAPTTTTAPPTTTAPTTTEQTVAPPPTTTAPTTTEQEVVPPATTTNQGRPKPKGVAKALDDLNPGDADSFPLPLLILGALAILLVAAGIVGMIWRRMDRGDTDADAGPA
jgi:cobalamin biosynthesis Mg chelatase CobN